MIEIIISLTIIYVVGCGIFLSISPEDKYSKEEEFVLISFWPITVSFLILKGIFLILKGIFALAPKAYCTGVARLYRRHFPKKEIEPKTKEDIESKIKQLESQLGDMK